MKLKKAAITIANFFRKVLKTKFIVLRDYAEKPIVLLEKTRSI